MTDRFSTHRAPVGTASLDLVPMVLLAEGDRSVRDVVRDVLELDDLRVLAASDGQEALRLAEFWMVDLLVTDVALPHLDGLELIRAVRRLYPGLPAIVTSADTVYQGRPLGAAAAELHVETMLLKPFDLADLQRAVRAAIPWSQPADPDVPFPARVEVWSVPRPAPEQRISAESH
jgi:CheY-like chemotaxis protein